MPPYSDLTEEESFLLKRYEEFRKKKITKEKRNVVKKMHSDKEIKVTLKCPPKITREKALFLLKLGTIKKEQVNERRVFKKSTALVKNVKTKPISYNAYLEKLSEDSYEENGNKPKVTHGQGNTSTTGLLPSHRSRNTICVTGHSLNKKLLQKLFSQYGKITVSLSSNERQGFVTFGDPSKVKEAIAEFNGSVIGDTKLHVGLIGDMDVDKPECSSTNFQDATTWQGAARTYSEENLEDEKRFPISYNDLN